MGLIRRLFSRRERIVRCMTLTHGLCIQIRSQHAHVTMPNTDEYLPSAEIPVMPNGCKLNNPVALRFLNCACVFVLQEQLSSVEEE